MAIQIAVQKIKEPLTYFYSIFLMQSKGRAKDLVRFLITEFLVMHATIILQ